MYSFVQQKKDVFADQLHPLAQMLDGGGLPALFSGLSEVHRAHLTAYLAGDWDGCVCVVCPDDASAERFARDLGAMLETDVPVIAARDFTFTAMDAVSRQAEQRRLGTLFALGGDTPPKAVVCTAGGLLQRTIPKQRLRDAAFVLENGGSCPIEDAEQRLLLCGFKPTEQVEGPGQFARRGGGFCLVLGKSRGAAAGTACGDDGCVYRGTLSHGAAHHRGRDGEAAPVLRRQRPDRL